MHPIIRSRDSQNMLYLQCYSCLPIDSSFSPAIAGEAETKATQRSSHSLLTGLMSKTWAILTSNFKPHHFPPFFVVTITCARASKYSIQSPLIKLERSKNWPNSYWEILTVSCKKMLPVRELAQLKFLKHCAKLLSQH